MKSTLLDDELMPLIGQRIKIFKPENWPKEEHFGMLSRFGGVHITAVNNKNISRSEWKWKLTSENASFEFSGNDVWLVETLK